MKTRKRIGLALVMTLVLLAWSGVARAGEIHDAAKAGDVAKVKALLVGNPDLVNARDNKGWTPLHWAANKGSKDVAELLLANRADVNARDNHGDTPLYAAIAGSWQGVDFNKVKDIIEILLSHKADVNAMNNDDRTPLYYTLVYGNKNPLAELLFQHGGKDIQTPRGQCITNLKVIGIACRMYFSDYGEQFPDNLLVLYSGNIRYIRNADVFKCPGDKTMQDIQKIDSNTRISYTYVKGLTTKGNPGAILAYDASPDNHEGKGRCVLFLDGSGRVAWYNENQFQELIKKQNQK